MRGTAVDCIKHGRERDTVKGARKMTACPRSWRRDRWRARVRTVPSECLSRATRRAAGRRDATRGVFVPRLIAMALVTVQRSPSVSSSPQSSVSFVHFSFLVTRRRVSLEWLTRVTIIVSFRGNAIVTSPPPRSAAARASSPRASSCNRPAALPYLAVLRQPRMG